MTIWSKFSAHSTITACKLLSAVLVYTLAGQLHAQEVTTIPVNGMKLEGQLLQLPHASTVQQTEKTLIPAKTTGDEPANDAASDVIGEGDQLLVTVFGQPDLTADVTIGESGVITLPLVGTVEVKGKTALEIASIFAKKLEQGQYIKNPRVSIKVIQQLSRTFSVLGEVLRPGRYPLQGQISILEALSLAGGVSQKAEKSLRILRREPGKPTSELQEYASIKLELDASTLPPELAQKIQPNDVLFVPQQKNFYVYGEVRRPGIYPMEEDLNVMRVLSIGGGVTERGSIRRIIIHRKTESGELREISAGIADKVQPGDVVFINERIF
ncbi:polysaccharide biosynthesis/export family protein [Undibacterium pigrum]|uniref:Polysaccharide export outer membrane protein n=1 Tax=Undibacterium pigrum TaxID=401470 RepID=A0A318JFW9_9BURK|nr:polysaccharide biosynthesis/export family protein [Undibacterium pigrum]PXX47456.1 polysaccharide export outer membrane protein [Undibacterium pigrum]